jgi:hypothetical protein
MDMVVTDMAMATDMVTDMDTVMAMQMRINLGGRNFSLHPRKRRNTVVTVPKLKHKEKCLDYLERKNIVW